MSFVTTIILLIALPFEYIKGEDHCSRSEKGKVECIPCSKLCPRPRQPCNISYHFCPNECGNSIPASECLDVCERNCLNGRCEYTNGRMDLACTGCEPEFTGKVCQEVCPPQCLECNQFNETCLTCKGNYIGPNCTEAIESTGVTIALSPSTDISIRNCSDNCVTCDVSTGVCKQCRKGRYGLVCQHRCYHCNLSLCAHSEACLECMGDLSCGTNTLSTTTVTQRTSEIFQKDERKDNMPLIYGLTAALLLTLCSVCIYLVMWKWCKSKYRVRTLQRDNTITDDKKNDRCSTGSLTANGGYTYIDDNDIELNFNHHVRTCHQSYESVGNVSFVAEDTESRSTVSSTIFGNLFELNVVLRERNQDNEDEGQSTHNHSREGRLSDGNSPYLSPALAGRNIT